MKCLRLLLLFSLLANSAALRADEAVIAVATNFADVARALKASFERDSSHRLRISTGSTGALYAQVVSGAPYDMLLAADEARPVRLVDEGFASAESRFTYAIGRLTLWSPSPDVVSADGVSTLRAAAFRKLAIANPGLAPYGLAARQTLQHLGLYDALQARLVMGANIGQAHAMVATGNAPLGFVALSYVLSPKNLTSGSRWDVPAAMHEPIRQDAVLLKRAANNTAAIAFLDFLQTEGARGIIVRSGYELPKAAD